VGLLEDLKNEANFPKARRALCSVCSLLQSLPKAEATLLQERFDDKKINHVSLSKVLRDNGISISDSVIGRHRRKVCAGVAKG
jgi:hypothetical protein